MIFEFEVNPEDDEYDDNTRQDEGGFYSPSEDDCDDQSVCEEEVFVNTEEQIYDNSTEETTEETEESDNQDNDELSPEEAERLRADPKIKRLFRQMYREVISSNGPQCGEIETQTNRSKETGNQGMKEGKRITLLINIM